MKQTKVKFPIGRADAFAAYTYDNNIMVLLCWSKEDFFDTFLYCILGIPEEKAEVFKAGEYAKFVTV